MYTDETLTCTQCGNEFTFTAGEQEFFAARGYANKPSRCKDCRGARRSPNATQAREMHPVTCAQCNKQTEVPFLPRNDKPVYCRECFQKMRSA
ncbi:MAG: zinc-binding protein [Candidatus Meridianibacter frigidus]|nr:MAG: zinc-binding protein [Candidatus Eremiobacteraeota bacterium]